jgi:uncharacterized protein (DUF362 family)
MHGSGRNSQASQNKTVRWASGYRYCFGSFAVACFRQAEVHRLTITILHTGELVEIKSPGACVFDKLTIRRSLVETDLLCSVPMMKTHSLAGLTLGMKNLIGA